MEIKKNTVATETTPKTEQYTCTVTRVHPINNKRIIFDMIVNGVSVSSFTYIEYTNAQGVDGTMISMPQEAYTDKSGQKKYANKVWFPISKELKDNIIAQIEKKVNE